MQAALLGEHHLHSTVNGVAELVGGGEQATGSGRVQRLIMPLVKPHKTAPSSR